MCHGIHLGKPSYEHISFYIKVQPRNTIQQPHLVDKQQQLTQPAILLLHLIPVSHINNPNWPYIPGVVAELCTVPSQILPRTNVQPVLCLTAANFSVSASANLWGFIVSLLLFMVLFLALYLLLPSQSSLWNYPISSRCPGSVSPQPLSLVLLLGNCSYVLFIL